MLHSGMRTQVFVVVQGGGGGGRTNNFPKMTTGEVNNNRF